MLINLYQVENLLLSVQVNIFEAKTSFLNHESVLL